MAVFPHWFPRSFSLFLSLTFSLSSSPSLSRRKCGGNRVIRGTTRFELPIDLRSELPIPFQNFTNKRNKHFAVFIGVRKLIILDSYSGHDGTIFDRKIVGRESELQIAGQLILIREIRHLANCLSILPRFNCQRRNRIRRVSAKNVSAAKGQMIAECGIERAKEGTRHLSAVSLSRSRTDVSGKDPLPPPR